MYVSSKEPITGSRDFRILLEESPIVEGAGGAPQDLPSAALQELRLALQADPHNFQCRELMDRAVSISGFEKIALELGRPS